jgi:peptidoglycan-associated lipoprotein
MNIKMLGALSAVVLLAGCAEKKETAAASGTGTTAAAPMIAPGSEEDLVKNVGDRVFFDFDKSALKPDAKETLDKQAAWLAKYPNVNVQVAGNCDERGTEEYNIALGQRRANAARDYLVAKGTASSRITTISYGKDRPQPDALCHDESCWSKNRNAITSVK